MWIYRQLISSRGARDEGSPEHPQRGLSRMGASAGLFVRAGHFVVTSWDSSVSPRPATLNVPPRACEGSPRQSCGKELINLEGHAPSQVWGKNRREDFRGIPSASHRPAALNVPPRACEGSPRQSCGRELVNVEGHVASHVCGMSWMEDIRGIPRLRLGMNPRALSEDRALDLGGRVRLSNTDD